MKITLTSCKSNQESHDYLRMRYFFSESGLNGCSANLPVLPIAGYCWRMGEADQ